MDCPSAIILGLDENGGEAFAGIDSAVSRALRNLKTMDKVYSFH